MNMARIPHRKVLVLTALVVACATGAAARADLPPAGNLVATIPISTPRDITTGYGSIWVANGPHRTVTRLDPATDAVLATIPVPAPASVLAVGAGAVWLTSFPGNSLTRIDPATNTVTGTISLASSGGLGPIGVTVYDRYVWIANHDGDPTGSVAKIDPASLQIVDLIPVGTQSAAGPTKIVSGAGSLWTDVPSIPAVVRIDPRSDAITAIIPDKGACADMAANDQAVWVADDGGAGCPGGYPGISRIDPTSNTVTAMLNGGGPTDALALDGTTLWYGTTLSDMLGRIDTASSMVVGQLKLPGPTFATTTADGYVWITDPQDNVLFKVQPS